MASLHYVDLGFSLRCPASFTAAQCDAYRSYEDDVFPHYTEIQAAATAELHGIVALAREKRRWSAWVDAAETELNLLDPFTYPAQKREITEPPDATSRIAVTPRAIEPPRRHPVDSVARAAAILGGPSELAVISTLDVADQLAAPAGSRESARAWLEIAGRSMDPAVRAIALSDAATQLRRVGDQAAYARIAGEVAAEAPGAR